MRVICLYVINVFSVCNHLLRIFVLCVKSFLPGPGSLSPLAGGICDIDGNARIQVSVFLFHTLPKVEDDLLCFARFYCCFSLKLGHASFNDPFYPRKIVSGKLTLWLNLGFPWQYKSALAGKRK